MGWYSTQNGILQKMTTYNGPLMTVALRVMEMLASVTVVRHWIQNLMMTMMVGVTEQKMTASELFSRYR